MDLGAIAKRANAATKGPWDAETTAECIRITRDDVPALVARVRELEAERELLQRQLDTAHGKRPGIWDTWAEHAARKRAEKAARPQPKPRLTLKQAREIAAHAALERARENGDRT